MVIGKMMTALKIVKNYSNWQAALRDATGRARLHEKNIYKLRNGVSIAARAGTSDLGIINTIFIGKETLDAVKFTDKSPVVIDLGAHIGAFSLYVASRASGAKIYSYEPFPESYSLLRENIKINRLDRRVKAFDLAVSDKRGKQKLFFDKVNNAGCSLDKNAPLHGEEEVAVKCITLKDVFDKNKINRCDLLKIDCEGYDYKILNALPAAYFRRIQAVHTEFHTKKQLELTKKLLEKHGMKIRKVTDNGVYGNIYASR